MATHLKSDHEEFTLEDCAGNPHQYRVYYHTPDEAMALCLRIAKAGGQALARVLENNLGLLVRSYLEGGLEGVNQEQILKKIIASAVKGDGEVKLDARAAVEDLADVLIESNELGLVRKIFGKTRRDEQSLEDDDAYNMAYMANYAEYRNALWRIVQANGFLDFLFGGLSTEKSSTTRANAQTTADLTGTQPSSEESPSLEASSTASP